MKTVYIGSKAKVTDFDVPQFYNIPRNGEYEKNQILLDWGISHPVYLRPKIY